VTRATVGARLRYTQVGAHRPMKWSAVRRIISQILRTNNDMTVTNRARCPGVLRGHPSRDDSVLWQSSLITHQDDIGHRMQAHQPCDTRIVPGQRAPGRVLVQ
jgi:hypothetical protein